MGRVAGAGVRHVPPEQRVRRLLRKVQGRRQERLLLWADLLPTDERPSRASVGGVDVPRGHFLPRAQEIRSKEVLEGTEKIQGGRPCVRCRLT